MHADGSHVRARTDTRNRYETDPDWSPNGKKIVFAAGPRHDSDRGSAIYKMKLRRRQGPQADPAHSRRDPAGLVTERQEDRLQPERRDLSDADDRQQHPPGDRLGLRSGLAAALTGAAASRHNLTPGATIGLPGRRAGPSRAGG